MTSGGPDLLSKSGDLGSGGFQAMENTARFLPITGDALQRLRTNADDQSTFDIHSGCLRSRAQHDEYACTKNDPIFHSGILLFF